MSSVTPRQEERCATHAATTLNECVNSTDAYGAWENLWCFRSGVIAKFFRFPEITIDISENCAYKALFTIL